MDDIQHDQNLMLVYATEGYAMRHGMKILSKLRN